MKLSATVPALVLSALASTSGTEALSGGRRSVQLNNKQDASSNNLVKRVSLAQMQQQENGNPGMVKKVKREPLAAPIAAAAGFGSIPSMNDGNMPIVGLSKRQHSFDEHNGKQGTAVVSQNTVSSKKGSSSNTSSSSDSTDSTDDDAEECDDEDDGDDDEDCEEEDDGDDDEECEEDDSADDEECEEDDSNDDDTEDCEEDDSETDDTTTSSSTSEDSSVAAATANANVNLKQSGSANSNNNGNGNNNPGNSGSSSSSSKQNNNNNGGQTRTWSSSAAASKTSSSTSSKATDDSSSSSSSADGSTYTGIATWYTQNGNAGACGTVNPDSARIIALYTSAYANGDNCGRSVVIKNLDDGTQTTATVADMCPSCGGPQDIDLSVGAFEAIDPEYQTHGVRNIEWYFTD